MNLNSITRKKFQLGFWEEIKMLVNLEGLKEDDLKINLRSRSFNFLLTDTLKWDGVVFLFDQSSYLLSLI